MVARLPALSESTDPWEQAAYEFLMLKARRSDSRCTYETYRRVLVRFFSGCWPPDQAGAAGIERYCYGMGPSGRLPAAATIRLRLACLSSFYRFLTRRRLITDNPCDGVDRPTRPDPVPRWLDQEQLRRLLAAVPVQASGRRDRAIIILGILTGRRREELLGLRARDLDTTGELVTYTYRGKGGVVRRRELPQPAYDAILATTGPLSELRPEDRLFQVSGDGFYRNLRRYLRRAGLPPAGVHVLRHSAARLRRRAGQSLEQVQAFLDHKSVATTAIYVGAMEGERDEAWRAVSELVGLR